MSRVMKPIPIRAAEKIAQDYGYDQVVVYARRVGDDPDPNGEHMVTYGRTKEHCYVAARMGTTLKRLMGWATEKDRWIEREAIRRYVASIPPDTHNLHCRAWTELNAEEQEVWRAEARADWEAD